ncbi:MAG: AAA family ATPase, partial [Anaerolineae bacterium]|nr:AAA family ATPase [Anaerolineae bacterium]
MTQRYNLQKIGELLQRGFSDQELRDFCFYTDAFRLTVYEVLPEGAGKKAEIIRLILDYAARQQLLETVLAWAEATNPEQFKVYQAELVTQRELAQETPYRGLAAFREEDAPLFFGRKTATAVLLTRALQHPLLAVFGASGSGKSSLVFAGLIPQLRAKGDWLVAACRPQASPFSTLAAALVPHLEPDLSETRRLIEAKALATALRQGDLTLTEVTTRLLEKSPTADHLLLIVDQFEELFTLCPDPTLRHRFLDVLLEATGNGQSTTNKPDTSAPLLPHSPAPLHLCLTLRADYLAEALAYRPLADALQTVNNLMLGPMTPAELRQAIETPAKLRGVTFQPGLVERILADVGHEPGHLPLLEFALASLWLQQSQSELNHPAYEALGGVAGALSGHANTVFAGLSETERDQARRLFLRLVQPGEASQDTRRLAYREELDNDTWRLAQKLAADRLVVTNRDSDQRETVEVIHEALITGWDQLRTWIEADRT